MSAARFSLGVIAVIVGIALVRRRLRGGGQARRKRIAFVHADDSKTWHDYCAHFRLAFDASGLHDWTEYCAWLGELPQPEKVDVVFVSGSRHNVHDEHEWIRGLLACVHSCTARPAVRVVGVCFGCQAVSVALGGQVGSNEGGTGFVLGVETLTPTAAWAASPFVLAACARALREGAPTWRSWPGHAASRPVLLPPRVLACHGQCVLALPPAAQLLASSRTTRHELFTVGPNVLCIQSHPEFWPGLIIERILPNLRAKGICGMAESSRQARDFEAYSAADMALTRALVTEFIN